MLRNKILAGLAGWALFVGTAAAADPALSFTTVNYPGAAWTALEGINPSGDIVGIYGDSAGHTHGFVLRQDAPPASIDFSNDLAGGDVVYTDARGISPGGDVVGSYFLQGEDPSVAAHGYLLARDGIFVRVHDPAHLNEILQRILPDDSVLGCYHDNDEMMTMHGVVYSQGQWTGLAVGISMTNGATPDLSRQTGLVYDMAASPPRMRAFLLQNGVFAPFDYPGASFTQAWDMNPLGAIVGSYRDSTGAHGFLLAKGASRPSNFLA